MTDQPGDHLPTRDVPQEGAEPAAVDSGGSSPMTRLWRRTAGAAAVVAVLIVGNATVNSTAASAATSSTEPAAGAPVATSDGEPSAAALHGEFRVINRDGSAQLRRWQSGAVNAIDRLSMTVRSADGFDSTYLLGPGVSVTGIGLGDEVTVVGAGQSVPGDG